MNTSKEQMSDYLERLQMWQRMSQGTIHSFEIQLSTLYGKDLTIHVWVHVYEWNADKTNTISVGDVRSWGIAEWVDEAENNATMLEIKKCLTELEMIEL
jgi:subtilisin-like proprotein convertase family protein